MDDFRDLTEEEIALAEKEMAGMTLDEPQVPFSSPAPVTQESAIQNIQESVNQSVDPLEKKMQLLEQAKALRPDISTKSEEPIPQSPVTSVPSQKLPPQDLLAQFKALQQKQNNQTQTANMLQSFSGLGDAIAKYYGGQPTDKSFYDRMRKDAEVPTKQFMDQFTTRKSMSDIQTLESIRDPKSPESRMAQRVAKKHMPDIDISEMSAEQIYKILPSLRSGGLDDYRNRLLEIQKKRLDQGERRLGLRGKIEDRMIEQFGYRRVEKFEDDAKSAVASLRQTDTWKAAEKAKAEIPVIRNLLNDARFKGGPSLSMLGPKVAKGLAGEVGVLTEQDVKRYVQNPALIGGLMDSYTKMRNGTITKASFQNLDRLLDIMEAEADRKLQAATLREAQLFAKREKLPIDHALYFIDPEFNGERLQESNSPDYQITDIGQPPAEYQEKPKSKSPPAPVEGKIDAGRARVKLPDGRIVEIDSADLNNFLEEVKGSKEIK